MLVTGTQEDCIDLFAAAVLEVRGLANYLREQRLLGEAARPVEAHGFGAIAKSHRLGAVFVTLRTDVLCGVATANQYQVLALKLAGVAKIVSVQNPAGKLL